MITIGSFFLPKPALLLAPMENISNAPFRLICRSMGADLSFSEFISADALIKNDREAQQKQRVLLAERPVGIQIFGGNEDELREASKRIGQENADLLDINFGCPVKKIVNKGAGAAVLKDIDLMVRLTKATVHNSRLPVTVKTRLGWDEKTKNIEEVVERLQDVGVRAITIHARTRVQQYQGVADWTLIGKIKNNPRIKIPIFGNGDIDSAIKAKEYLDRYGVDGLMLGRAAIGYPWIFREVKHFLQTGEILPPPSLRERINICLQHLTGDIQYKGERVAILEMRRNYRHYLPSSPTWQAVKEKLIRMEQLTDIYNFLHSLLEIEK